MTRRNIRKNLLRSESSFKSFAFAKDLHAKDAKEWPFFQALLYNILVVLFIATILFWVKDGREQTG